MTIHFPNGNLVRRFAERLAGKNIYAPSTIFRGLLRATRPNPFREFNDRHCCIFVHVPRAAGTSVANALFEEGDRGHIPLYAYQSFDADRYQRYTKIAFVRNPYSRLVSAFHQVKFNAHNEKVQAWAERYLSDIDTFDVFLDRLHASLSFRLVVMSLAHFRPQWEFLMIDGEIAVDFLGRFETINRDFERLAEQLSVDARLGHMNRSDHDAYLSYYTESTSAIVRRIYQKDFALLDYTMMPQES